MMMFETPNAPESQINPQDIQQTKTLMDIVEIYFNSHILVFKIIG